MRIVIDGPDTVLDLANPEPFIAAAGAKYVGTDPAGVLVRARDGSTMLARQGWVVIQDRVSGGPVFVTPDMVPA